MSTFPVSDLGEDCVLPELFPLIFNSFFVSGDVGGDFLCKTTYLSCLENVALAILIELNLHVEFFILAWRYHSDRVGIQSGKQYTN